MLALARVALRAIASGDSPLPAAARGDLLEVSAPGQSQLPCPTRGMAHENRAAGNKWGQPLQGDIITGHCIVIGLQISPPEAKAVRPSQVPGVSLAWPIRPDFSPSGRKANTGGSPAASRGKG